MCVFLTALTAAVKCNHTELLPGSATAAAHVPPGQRRQSALWMWITTRRIKNQIQKFTSASLSFRRQDCTGQRRNTGECKCLIFFWSVAAYLVKDPALFYDPAVSPGILSAAIMLTVLDKTLQGQWEMMHDRAVERGSKYNVPCPWDFSRGGNSLNTLLALAYKEQV